MLGIKLLREAGTKKINFAGGEPFLYHEDLGHMCKFSKELGMAVSIVSNGSKIKESWFEKWGQYLDILAISCDSFDEPTNVKIGRGNGKHVKQVYKVAEWCRKYEVKFKLNSVICSYNHEEDMNEHIQALAPFRWKVFQVLLIDGENVGSNKTNKHAEQLQITKQQFDAFTKRHASQQSLVPESNEIMKDSYLILDEQMRFLNCQNGKKDPSQSILEVDVETALSQSGFDGKSFLKRQGIYDWVRRATAQPSCATGPMRDIEDLHL
jgi:radical S-adenosyl methionine domain-containing protein 2